MRKKKSYRIFLIALMTLSIAFGLSSCIGEDMSKCGKDYKIKYNLRLNTDSYPYRLRPQYHRGATHRQPAETGTRHSLHRPCPRQRFVFLYRK